MNKPEIGQTLYSLNVGTAAKHNKQKLTPVVVTKIGRKYFTCKPCNSSYFSTQYHLSDWREKTDYTAESEVYFNPQAWEDQKETTSICGLIWKAFEYGQNRENVPLDRLRIIEEIIKGEI